MIPKCKKNQHEIAVSEAMSLMDEALEKLSASQSNEIIEITRKLSVLHSLLNELNVDKKKSDILAHVVEVESDIYERIALLEDVCSALRLASDELNFVSSEYHSLVQS